MYSRAKLLLKKKRYQEQILIKTDGQLENLESLVHDLEFALVEVQVMEGLKTGNEALKKIHEVLRIEDIERILDETAEAVEKQMEIDEVLSGVMTHEDDDAVLQELDDLIKESLPAALIDGEPMETDVELPDVPQNEPGREKEKNSREKKILVAAS